MEIIILFNFNIEIYINFDIEIIIRKLINKLFR